VASKHGHIARHLHAFIKSDITAKRSGITGDLPVVLNHNAPPEGGHITQNVSAHPNAAAKAGHVRRLVAGRDGDAPPELGAIASAVCERGARKRSGKNEAGQYHGRLAKTSPHRTSNTRQIADLVGNYGTASWKARIICPFRPSSF
jgi:hypothetical protein